MLSRSGASLWRPFMSACAMLLVLAAATPASSSAENAAGAPEQPDAVLYRVFLRDGGMLVSYGEFAHVADRVIVSIPIGGTDSNPVLHLLTLAREDVDWERTNAYVQAARARRYADTRGEADFASLTREVADTLYQVGQVTDPAKRLALAESARRRLVEWPREHYGYRAEELSQMTTWLDQVVSELRVAAGHASFEFSLVAGTPVTIPAVQLLPAPDLRERAEFGLLAARKTPDPAERVSLLQAVIDSLQPDAPAGTWMAAVRTRASTELGVELKTNQAYADLTKRALAKAGPLAERADVRGLETLIKSVLDEDARLQRTRPGDIAGLLAALDTRIDSARRLRLARDAWTLRTAVLRTYWRDVREGLDRLLGLREWLVDVRQLAGPSPGALRRVAYEAQYAGNQLSRVQAPPEVASAHATVVAACGMAARAATTRLDALRSGSMDTAWQASSAAAGSLMMIDQAVQELRRITREPKPGLPSR